ncbi:SDR family oxidoreductase [Haloarchaeobius iranensis]|uniref:Short-chain dehydrogenase n=1 Tax=Haloarchaeobius iranensis TaxID=996166 RepID=A0A1G9T7Z7_9EURY|nr:SDR family oxidoreductase [Haloarchaeobius iranensis]SDM43767.1 Short-chain dehydrogenase [Haloarchaeobius iranensis]
MTADEDDDSPEEASATTDDEESPSAPEPTLETVLITGCSSGIGRATATAFRSEGWLVYATARDEDDLADLADMGCETAELDVTDRGQVERVVDRIVDEAGHIDCVVNNAGYAQMGPIEDVPTEKVHEQFDVNVYGPHRLVRATAPHMREAEDGTFVNVSSVSGKLSVAGTGVYSASKFAVEAMSDALRSELREFDVEVVVVEPGPVATQFTDRADSEVDDLPRSEAYDDLYELFEDASLVAGDGPLSVTPNQVAGVILNAASSTDPATRYPVGAVAKYGLLARYLPDRIRDVVVGLVRRFAT